VQLDDKGVVYPHQDIAFNHHVHLLFALFNVLLL
jgi:hypothetical protein